MQPCLPKRVRSVTCIKSRIGLRGRGWANYVCIFTAAVMLAAGACSRSEQTNVTAAPPTDQAAAPADSQTPPTEPETPAMADPRTHALTAEQVSQLTITPIATLDGDPSSLASFDGKALLLVNVASKCGLTPQYAKLEALQKQYADRGLTVVGFPCNQFGGQEPGTAEEIRTFCATNYGITFPMMEKVEVNGDGRHPIYTVLTSYPDIEGQAGDVKWNFEKFIVSADRTKISRFRPQTEPDDADLIEVLEASF